MQGVQNVFERIEDSFKNNILYVLGVRFVL